MVTFDGNPMNLFDVLRHNHGNFLSIDSVQV